MRQQFRDLMIFLRRQSRQHAWVQHGVSPLPTCAVRNARRARPDLL